MPSLQDHLEHPASCCAFWALSIIEEHRAMLVKTGCAELAIAAMQRHGPLVQKTCYVMFTGLTRTGMDSLKAASLFDQVLHDLEAIPPLNHRCVLAMHLLQKLASIPEVKTTIIHRPGIQTVITVLEKNRASAVAQDLGIATLSEILDYTNRLSRRLLVLPPLLWNITRTIQAHRRVDATRSIRHFTLLLIVLA
jgi:hypothetical protein